MKPPENVLDHLARAAQLHLGFPGIITKRGFEGAHGKSVTIDLLIEAEDGETYRITCDRQPKPRS